MSDTDPSVRRATVVDLVLGFCSLTYGSAPCTAAIGTTGTDRCYNTRGTCQDVTNYTATTKTYRFALANGPRLPGVQAWYHLESVSIAAARLDDKRGMGGVSDVTITIGDFLHEDEGVDPYRTQRSSVDARQFFARLIKRNPHYRGSSVVVREGTLDADGSADVDSWATRTYLLDSIELDPSGRVKITAKDAIAKLDTTIMPQPVNVELSAGMDASQTTATVKTGQGAALGTAPFWFRVDNEIMEAGTIVADALSDIVRNEGGTTAATHAADAKVTKCRVWESAALDTVWANILTDAGLVAGQIDSAGAATEVAYVAGDLSFTAYLSEPRKASEWMRVLMMSSGAFTWWDPVAAKVKLKTNRPRAIGETATTITEALHVALGSVGFKLLEDRTVTRGTIYLAPKDWSADLDDPSNYSRVAQYIDAVEETAYGAVKEKPPTFAPFAPASQFGEMESRIYREISRFVRPPRRVTVDMALRDAASLYLVDDIDLTVDKMVNDAGTPEAKQMRITKIGYPKDGGIRYSIEMETTETEGKWGQWTDESGTELAKWCDDNGVLTDGTPGWRWV